MKKALQTLNEVTTRLDSAAIQFQVEKDTFDERWTERLAECDNESIINEMGAFAPGFREYLEEFKSKNAITIGFSCSECKRQPSTLSSCGACVSKNKPYYCEACSPLKHVPCGTTYDFKSICIDCHQRLKLPHSCKNLFCIDCKAEVEPQRWKERDLMKKTFPQEVTYRNGCKRPAYVAYYNQSNLSAEGKARQEEGISAALATFKPIPPM